MNTVRPKTSLTTTMVAATAVTMAAKVAVMMEAIRRTVAAAAIQPAAAAEVMATLSMVAAMGVNVITKEDIPSLLKRS